MTSVTGDRQARRPAPCLLRSTRALPLSVSNASREIHHEGTKTRSERGFPARVRCTLVDAHGWLRHPLADFEHDCCPISGGEPHGPRCARHAGAPTLVRSSPAQRAAIVLKFSERMLGGAEHSGGHHEAACHSCGTSSFVSSLLRGENSREALRATKGGGQRRTLSDAGLLLHEQRDWQFRKDGGGLRRIFAARDFSTAQRVAPLAWGESDRAFSERLGDRPR